MRPKDAFAKLVSERKIVKNGPHFAGTVPQRLERIKKELAEIEKEVKAAEADKAKGKMREVDYDATVLEELEAIKGKLSGLVQSKGYQEMVQWETPGDASKLFASGINEKITENLLKSCLV